MRGIVIGRQRMNFFQLLMVFSLLYLVTSWIWWKRDSCSEQLKDMQTNCLKECVAEKERLEETWTHAFNEKNGDLNFVQKKLEISNRYLSRCEEISNMQQKEMRVLQSEKNELKMQMEGMKSGSEESMVLVKAREKLVEEKEKWLDMRWNEIDEKLEALRNQERIIQQRELQMIYQEIILQKQLQDQRILMENVSDYKSKYLWRKPLTYAVFRILYGEDFLMDSVLSIIEYVDKIFIFWDDRPWGGVRSAQYKGKVIPIPSKIDNVVGTV